MRNFWDNVLAMSFAVFIAFMIVGSVCAVAGYLTLLNMFLSLGLVIVVFLLTFILGAAGIITWSDRKSK